MNVISCESVGVLARVSVIVKVNTLLIFYKNVIFLLKPLKEIEIATNKITTMFLILERFQALMFL